MKGAATKKATAAQVLAELRAVGETLAADEPTYAALYGHLARLQPLLAAVVTEAPRTGPGAPLRGLYPIAMHALTSLCACVAAASLARQFAMTQEYNLAPALRAVLRAARSLVSAAHAEAFIWHEVAP